MKRLPAATSVLHRKHSPSGRACCETLFSWSWEVKNDEKRWDFQWFTLIATMVTPFPKDQCVRHRVIPAIYPSSSIQNSKYAPYISIWSQIPVKFPISDVFQCHDCTKKQSFHQPISTESTATPPSLPRLLQPFSSIRWKAVRVASSQWKNSASAYVSGERTVKQWTRMFYTHVFLQKEKCFEKKASEAPNSLRH